MGNNSEGVSSVPCTVQLSAVKLDKVEFNPKECQDVKVLQKELEQLAEPLKQRSTLEYTQASVVLTLGILFRKGFSRMTICQPEVLQLGFKSM